jgi:transposase InsO family protein
MDLADRVITIKLLLRDRDSRFTTAFDAVFAVPADGIRILISPAGAPRANAICERMIGTPRRELLDKILIVNERHLRRIPRSIFIISTLRDHTARSGNSPRPKPEPDPHKWSTSPIARFAADQSSTGSFMNTTLPHDRIAHHNLQVKHKIAYSSPTGSGLPA